MIDNNETLRKEARESLFDAYSAAVAAELNTHAQALGLTFEKLTMHRTKAAYVIRKGEQVVTTFDVRAYHEYDTYGDLKFDISYMDYNGKGWRGTRDRDHAPVKRHTTMKSITGNARGILEKVLANWTARREVEKVRREADAVREEKEAALVVELAIATNKEHDDVRYNGVSFGNIHVKVYGTELRVSGLTGEQARVVLAALKATVPSTEAVEVEDPANTAREFPERRPHYE